MPANPADVLNNSRLFMLFSVAWTFATMAPDILLSYTPISNEIVN